YPEVHAFGAFDEYDALWDDNSDGPVAEHPPTHKPDFVAPGVNVETAGLNGAWRFMTGTSCASALGAGVGAVLLSEARAAGRTVSLRSELLRRGKMRPLGAGQVCQVRF